MYRTVTGGFAERTSKNGSVWVEFTDGIDVMPLMSFVVFPFRPHNTFSFYFFSGCQRK